MRMLKRFLAPLIALTLVLAPVSTAQAAIALVAHTYVGGSNGGTTASIDTTGATLLVISVGAYDITTGLTISDSKTCTWTPLALFNGSGSSNAHRFYYATNVSGCVGSGHTFTFSKSGSYATIVVGAYSGVHTTAPYDQTSAGGAGATPLQGGSITPGTSGSLFVAGCSPADGSSGAAVTSATGFAAVETIAYAGGTSEGESQYWKEVTSAENPTFTWTGTASPGTCQSATFLPGSAPPPPTGNKSGMLLGVGQ